MKRSSPQAAVAAVAIGAEAIERIGGHLRGAGLAAEILRKPGRGRHAGVVEMLVGEARAVVAGHALALADEQFQAERAPRAESVVAFGRLPAGGKRLGKTVEARLRAARSSARRRRSPCRYWRRRG